MEQWATAKINLFLRVLDRRADGYHNIETVYQSVGLADRLTIQAAADEIVVDCRGGDAPSGRENIAYRAVELMQRCFPGRVGAVHIEIEKRIPIGSGLGGGSADAATVLRACNTLFSLGLSAERLRLPGSQLGMDVPFLIKGGRAIGRERGDQLSPLAVGESGWAVIAVPHLSISTRWAYEQLAVRQSCGAPSVEDFVDHLETKPLKEWAALCHNDFGSVVFARYPELGALRDRLIREGCHGAALSGSGSAIVGLTDDPQQGAWVAQRIRATCRLAEAVPFLTVTDLGDQFNHTKNSSESQFVVPPSGGLNEKTH